MNRPSYVPKVSIGMPVYNGELFLRKAIDSLLGQTFTDIELIISDNVSTDSTADICKEYASIDRRVRYIRQTEHKISTINFRQVLNEARGVYFMWAACDDMWDKSYISILVGALEANSNIVCAFCPYTFIDENDNRINVIRSFDYSGKNTLARILKLTYYYDDGFFYGLFRRESIAGMKLPTWWWINSAIPSNSSYPPLYYILASGNYMLSGEYPLMLKRWHTKHYYITQPYRRAILRNLIAFVIRKINLYYESIRSIYSANGNLIVLVSSALILACRCVYDSADYLLKIITKVLKKIKYYSKCCYHR